jgi:hypothetical protein
MTSDIKWTKGIPDANARKFDDVLKAIKQAQKDDPTKRAYWAHLEAYDIEQSARSAAWNMKRRYPDFEFASRKDEDGITHLYARLKEGAK